MTSCTMSDMSSALIRLGRLMELQGIASSRAGAAAETVTKRKSKGASGDGGATATAAETGTPPQVFGARRIGGQTDRQLKPPRRRGSLASREGEVRHKKINGGRQSNGGLSPLLKGCAVHLIFNWQKQGPSQRHATSRRSS